MIFAEAEPPGVAGQLARRKKPSIHRYVRRLHYALAFPAATLSLLVQATFAWKLHHRVRRIAPVANPESAEPPHSFASLLNFQTKVPPQRGFAVFEAAVEFGRLGVKA